MRVFFDQNVPRELARHLTGHTVTRAAELDWQELKNGELLTRMELHAFMEGRKIAVVSLSTNNWPLVKQHTGEVARAVDEAAPGSYRPVNCGEFVPQRARKNKL